VINAQVGGLQAAGSLPYILLNHFTAYQIAVGTLLGLMTGGFALIKSRQMFARGNRYFLFAILGNYPFSWAVEDFAYFIFNPLGAATLKSSAWSTWFLGGVYAYSPWMPGNPKPEFFIPTWYFLVFVWFLGCNWYAHRCTVYDNLLKDEIGKRILPKVLPRTQDEPQSPRGIPTPVPAPEPPTATETPIGKETPPQPSTAVVPPAPAPSIEIPKAVETTPKRETKVTVPTPVPTHVPTKPRVRSEDAEAALKRLRERWLKNDKAQTGD